MNDFLYSFALSASPLDCADENRLPDGIVLICDHEQFNICIWSKSKVFFVSIGNARPHDVEYGAVYVRLLLHVVVVVVVAATAAGAGAFATNR